jgi:hypothetical protein
MPPFPLGCYDRRPQRTLAHPLQAVRALTRMVGNGSRMVDDVETESRWYRKVGATGTVMGWCLYTASVAASASVIREINELWGILKTL